MPPHSPSSGLPAEAPVIEARALTRAFDRRLVVDRVDLAVNRGEIFGLIGPNGAGKSTLIKMLTTLLPPSSGNAQIAGCDLKRDARQLRRNGSWRRSGPDEVPSTSAPTAARHSPRRGSFASNRVPSSVDSSRSSVPPCPTAIWRAM